MLTFQSAAPQQLIAQRIRHACGSVRPFRLHLTDIQVSDFWGKPDLRIVMLADSNGSSSGVHRLRTRALESLGDTDLELIEGGPLVPHLTLTTGVPTLDAARLCEAAATLNIEFDVDGVHLSMPNNEVSLPLGARV